MKKYNYIDTQMVACMELQLAWVQVNVWFQTTGGTDNTQ